MKCTRQVFFPFPKEVDAIPDFSACTSDNERESLKATHALNQKTRADIIRMNWALANVFLANLSKAICETYKPIRMKNPNMVFLHMFKWFIEKYGKTTTKDCKANRQRMAAKWHPANGFELLATCLFIGPSYVSAVWYPMSERDVIDIGLRIINWCGMYSKEYKNWIARESESLPIVETIDSFKEYLSRMIALINQMAAPASQHGYGMAAVNDNESIALYNETLTNFSATYAATQETIKSQATSLAAMQGQLANIQQFCMAVGQQPPSNIYAPTQHQGTSNKRGIRRNGKGQGGGESGGGNQQPTWCTPTPYKQWENWNYCHMHGGDIEDCHMSATCGNPGRCTTRTQPAPTWWADQRWACIKQSCPW
jgi:hypothetical protein